MDEIVRTASVRLAGKPEQFWSQGCHPACHMLLSSPCRQKGMCNIVPFLAQEIHTIVYIKKRIFQLWQVFAEQ